MLKLKLLPRSTLKGKVGTHFPASIIANPPLQITQANGGYTIGLDGAYDFLSLIDTPDSYFGQGGKSVRINPSETALEFATVAGSGTVTGPVSSTDLAIARWDGVSGIVLQNSIPTISDDGDINVTANKPATTLGLDIFNTSILPGTRATLSLGVGVGPFFNLIADVTSGSTVLFSDTGPIAVITDAADPFSVSGFMQFSEMAAPATPAADKVLLYAKDVAGATHLFQRDNSGTEINLTTGGSGGTPGGANTEIQFNDGGSFGGDTDFTWNKTTNTLGLATGTVLNWGGGDVTLTHSADTLVIGGAGAVSIGISGELTVGTIQIGNLADTTLSRSAAGVLAVEGNDVLTTLTGQPLDADLSAIAGLATTGLITRTGAGTVATRTLTGPGSGLSISNGDGVAGNPTISLTGDLNALEALAGTDTIYFRKAADTWIPLIIGANLTFNTGTNTLSASSGSAVVGDGNYTDITVSSSGTVWTINADAVTNAKLADMAAATVKGQIVGGSGNPVDLTATQLMAIVQTVDGSGSGLDADLLDGNSSAFYATATGLSDHLGDTSAAHAASAISFTPAGTIAASDVQAALVELDNEKQPLDADLTSWALITRAGGFDTFVATPSSANLAALVTGETGTGALVFNVSPSFTTPVLGTPTSGTLTNCAGLPTVLVANEAADTSCFVTFTTAAGAASPGSELGIKTNANLTFNSATGVLSVGGSPVITTTTGAASVVVVANEATDTTCFLGFYTDPSGNLAAKTNANMTFNSATGVVTFASSVLTTTAITGGTINSTTIGATTPAAGTFTAAVANSFVPNSATIPSNGMYLPAANTLGWAISTAAELQLTGTALSPAVDGGSSLGTTTLGWQNLFANTGFVLNIENGNWVATHTTGILTVGTGDLRVTTVGTNTASVVTVGGTQTLTGKTIDSASNTITNIDTGDISAVTLVTAADTIALNDNDATWPTTAAIIDYAQPLDATLSALAAFATNGLLTRTGVDAFAGRTLIDPASGLVITDGDGVAGNPTFALANDLAALEALAGTDNIYYRSGVDTWTAVTFGANITFTGGEIAVSTGTATVGDGDYGDIVVSSTGTVWTIDTNVVTYAKMQDVSAADNLGRLLGRGTAGSGDPQEIILGTGLSMSGTTLNSTGGSGAPTTSQYVVLALDGTLSAERVLVAGAGLALTDGGANGNATLDVGAGTGISVAADTVAVDTTVVPLKSDNLSVFATTTSAQLAGVITNETGSGLLVFGTSPVLTTPQINDATSTDQYIFATSELTADRTVTLPLLTGNDTFVFEAHTQTLTNKTIALGSNTISGTTAQFNTALTDGDFATLAGSETLTGKTINLASNTLTGTTAQFNTALSDNDFATLAGTETLTNKTLTLPQINDTSSDHQYVFAVSELIADRTVTLPLLTSSDTFVFEAHTQTLTNKTLTSPTIGGSPTAAGATWTSLGIVTTADINGGTLDNVAIGATTPSTAVVTTLTSQTILPASDGLYDLGSTTLAWNNLHLDTGATINIENGNWVATHTTGILTVGTGDLRVTTAGTNTASVVTVGGTQTLTAKSISLTTNTVTGTVAEFNIALSGADFYTTGGTDVALADGGTGASLADPNIDLVMGWDDSAAAVKFMTVSDINTEAAPTSGDFVLMYDAAGNLLKTDWANLPGAGGGAPSTSQYLTLAFDGSLSAERVLTAGNGIAFVDAGANSTLTISADAASTSVDGIVQLSTTTEVLTGTATDRANTPDSLAALWEKGSAVASAATTSLGEGGYFHITGTTTITDLDFATAKDGRTAIVQFDGALTLTHNATTLVLPGGASITTAAGDCAIVVQDSADNIKVVDYFRASGLPLDPTLAALGGLDTTAGHVVQTGTDTFTKRTITGTASRLAVTNGSGVGGNPTLDIDAAYVGQSTITTVGTITTGVWTGTDIAFANIAQGTARSVLGVTGNATADMASIQGTASQVLRVNAANTALTFQSSAALTKSDDTNVTLTLGGTPTTALLDATSLTLGWTGTLAVSRGGIGVGTITGLMQGNGTSAVTGITNSSTVGQVLRVTGASTYAWGALDLADADAITGDLPYANLTPSANASRLLGRTDASAGDWQEITLGTNLSMSGTQLNVSGGSGDVTAASTFVADNRIIRSDGTGKGVQSSGVSINDSGSLGISVTGAEGGEQGIGVFATQTTPHDFDNGDSVGTFTYTMSAASATNQTVSRVFRYDGTNSLTGGGVLGNMRIMNIRSFCGVGSTTTLTEHLAIEGSNSGTTGTTVGLAISSLAGTTIWGIKDDVTGSRWSHAGTEASTSTTTGALRVAGGVGVGGNLYVGGATLGLAANAIINWAGGQVQIRQNGTDEIIFEHGQFVTHWPNSTTNAVTYSLKVSTESTATPLNGMGSGIQFQTETAATNYEIGATLFTRAYDVTGAAECLTFDAQQMASGSLQEPLGVSFLFRSLTASAAYTNNASAQDWFPTLGDLQVEASTTYEFEGHLYVQTTGATTTHTIATSFAGTATLTSIGYVADAHHGLVNATATTANSTYVNQATATIINALSGTTSAVVSTVRVRGLVRINAAGTFIPQWTMSVARGAGNTLLNSFFKMRKVGSNTNTVQGRWT